MRWCAPTAARLPSRGRRAAVTPTREQAFRKMTSLPASRVGLRDRGWISPGLAADVVVFDPATIEDRATFADPFRYPAGIKAVLVNGSVTLLDDARGERRSGVPLRVR